MREIDYIRLIDITKEYFVEKVKYDYLKAYWDRVHKEKGNFQVYSFIVPNNPIVQWTDDKLSEDALWVQMQIKR